MSNNNENMVWEDVTPSLEFDHFHDWLELETFFGEFGEPGLSQVDKVFTNPNRSLSITFTLYRGENGALLGVHGFYVENNVQKPFIFMVHPNNLRTGIGTQIANFVINQFKENKGREFDYEQSWRDVPVTESAANFMNKYAKNEYDRINNEGSLP